MPRDGSDVYNVPSGTYGVEDTTIESARYNAFVDDVAQDLNHPRPVLSGGTGETNARDALLNLSGELALQVVSNFDSDPLESGSFYSASTATNPPVAGHAFAGIIYLTDANNLVVEARDAGDTATPGRLYVREKKAGVWGAWHADGRTVIGTNEGIGGATADMFFGLTGTSPASMFIVNSKADASGSNLMTVRKSDGAIRGNGLCPAGCVLDFATPVAPAGWLVCDGSAVSRVTYADLFTAVGTIWGPGDGSNTFNLPSLNNRFRRAAGTLAGVVGNLQAPANLAHTHGVTGNTGNESVGHTHPVSITSGTESANHTHNVPVFVNNGVGGGSTFVVYSATAMNSGGGSSASSFTTGIESATHTHAVSGSTGAVSADHTHPISLTSAGGSADDPSESRPYSATVLTCIKA